MGLAWMVRGLPDGERKSEGSGDVVLGRFGRRAVGGSPSARQVFGSTVPGGRTDLRSEQSSTTRGPLCATCSQASVVRPNTVGPASSSKTSSPVLRPWKRGLPQFVQVHTGVSCRRIQRTVSEKVGDSLDAYTSSMKASGESMPKQMDSSMRETPTNKGPLHGPTYEMRSTPLANRSQMSNEDGSHLCPRATVPDITGDGLSDIRC